jgi:hypothetical protein
MDFEWSNLCYSDTLDNRLLQNFQNKRLLTHIRIHKHVT